MLLWMLIACDLFDDDADAEDYDSFTLAVCEATNTCLASRDLFLLDCDPAQEEAEEDWCALDVDAATACLRELAADPCALVDLESEECWTVCES